MTRQGMRLALRWIAGGHHGIVNAANAKATHQTAPPPLFPCKTATCILLDCQPCSLPTRRSDFVTRFAATTTLLHRPPVAFEKLLGRILPDPAVRGRVQEYVGYTLLPDARFQLAQLCLGSGANGKGTLANIVQAVHERKAAVSPSSLNGFQAAVVLGASLLFCDEAPATEWCEQTIKSMIAGESVLIDRKYLPPITSRVCGKWLILANHIPTVKDQSNGFWRRFDIVPFSVEIPASERDPMLADHIIKHELTGVLNWALEGLQRLLARGRFDAAPTAMRALPRPHVLRRTQYTRG